VTRSNPCLKGKQIDVTGTLATYFSHPGLKNGTAFSTVGGTTPLPAHRNPFVDHPEWASSIWN
jgi:hypothetical protein